MKFSVHDFILNLNEDDFYLLIGRNGSGKEKFLVELEKYFSDDCEVVSLEKATSIIQYERENDESEFVKGGVDVGRTGRVFILQSIFPTLKKDSLKNLSACSEDLKEASEKLIENAVIKFCGVQKVLDRGLKYMSTGEIRRIMLARALYSKKKKLLVSNLFEGLDVHSRKIFMDFFESYSEKERSYIEIETNERSEVMKPQIIFSVERWAEIPRSVTKVLEFSKEKEEVSFFGAKNEYEKILEQRKKDKKEEESNKEETEFLEEMIFERGLGDKEKKLQTKEKLVQMNNVNVAWGENHVLKNLSWELYKGEHYLVRGPNGSGKTTFLELITGDNKQVYSNDVWIFGIKRGSGESIWDIKKYLGIVSYRIHVEYRMLFGISLRDVVISGFYDSIGLYEKPTEMQISSANKWLSFGGFAGRETEAFSKMEYGEQRAILILRAIVKNPSILILDEPCHGLDENFRKKILTLMNHIDKQSETTMLHVTHDETEILECEKNILELRPECEPMYKIIHL